MRKDALVEEVSPKRGLDVSTLEPVAPCELLNVERVPSKRGSVVPVAGFLNGEEWSGLGGSTNPANPVGGAAFVVLFILLRLDPMNRNTEKRHAFV